MATLWELSDDLLKLENLITLIEEEENLSKDEKEAKVNQVFEDWLQTSEDFAEKALRVAAYIRHQESIADARKKESQRLRDLANEAQSQADRLKGYLIRQMKLTGKTKIEGIDGKLSLRKKPPKLCLNIDPRDLPDEYKKVEVTPKLAEIKKAIKVNTNIDWAYFDESDEYSLTIR